MKTHHLKRILITAIKCTVTLAVMIGGIHAARLLWNHYRVSPWTRDGRVIAETVKIVPEVSGKISRVLVADNETVKKDQPLFIIDDENYALALRNAEATLATREHELALKEDIAIRRRKLANDQAISTEEARIAENALEVARFAVIAAIAARDLAKLDLGRTVVISPVNGYVTNLHLRTGDYASAGSTQFAIIDSDSFWIAGYFEETKLPSIRPGAKARIDLMAGGTLSGEVESMSRGIADTASSTKGLADVDPVFNWVRLAQRIPVRIKLDAPPEGLFLSSGMTCNIHIIGPDPKMNKTPLTEGPLASQTH